DERPAAGADVRTVVGVLGRVSGGAGAAWLPAWDGGQAAATDGAPEPVDGGERARARRSGARRARPVLAGASRVARASGVGSRGARAVGIPARARRRAGSRI